MSSVIPNTHVWKINRKPQEHKSEAIARLFAERTLCALLSLDNAEVVLSNVKRTNKAISADVSPSTDATQRLWQIMLKFWRETHLPQTGSFVLLDPIAERTCEIQFIRRDGPLHLYSVVNDGQLIT